MTVHRFSGIAPSRLGSRAGPVGATNPTLQMTSRGRASSRRPVVRWVGEGPRMNRTSSDVWPCFRGPSPRTERSATRRICGPTCASRGGSRVFGTTRAANRASMSLYSPAKDAWNSSEPARVSASRYRACRYWEYGSCHTNARQSEAGCLSPPNTIVRGRKDRAYWALPINDMALSSARNGIDPI